MAACGCVCACVTACTCGCICACMHRDEQRQDACVCVRRTESVRGNVQSSKKLPPRALLFARLACFKNKFVRLSVCGRLRRLCVCVHVSVWRCVCTSACVSIRACTYAHVCVPVRTRCSDCHRSLRTVHNTYACMCVRACVRACVHPFIRPSDVHASMHLCVRAHLSRDKFGARQV